MRTSRLIRTIALSGLILATATSAIAQTIVLPPRPLDRKFPAIFCPFEFLMTFTPQQSQVTVRFEARTEPGSDWTRQGIDNIAVVPYSTYQANHGTCPACTAYTEGSTTYPVQSLFFNRPGLTIPFLELFQTDPCSRRWDLSQGAIWDTTSSAPNNPETGFNGQSPKGYLRFGDNTYQNDDVAHTSVVVSGLTPGVPYALTGWWTSDDDDTELIVSADHGAPIRFEWPTDPSEPLLVYPSHDGWLPGAIGSVPDGAGGVWASFTVPFDSVYVRHVSSSGERSTALLIAREYFDVESYPQLSARSAPDGTGGVVVVWCSDIDGTTGRATFRAQRVTAAGAKAWGASGIALTTLGDVNSPVAIVSDAQGGAIFAWIDHRVATPRIYAQRITAAGTKSWGTSDLLLYYRTPAPVDPVATSDGAGGAVIAWTDTRMGSLDVFAQRVSAEGDPTWSCNGAPVCTATGDQTEVALSADATGAVFAWQDFRTSGSTSSDIYAQRLGPNSRPRWAANGVPISTATGALSPPVLATDGAGGALLGWRESSGQFRGQHVDSIGLALWATNGKVVATGGATAPGAVVSDGAEGAIYAWSIGRGTLRQRIRWDGTTLWGGYFDYDSNVSPSLVADGAGGAIAMSVDPISSVSDDFEGAWAMRVDSHGYLGGTEPRITSLQDVPADQGGQVSLTWLASPFDGTGSPSVIEYRILSRVGAGVEQAVATVLASALCQYSRTVPCPSIQGSTPASPAVSYRIEAYDATPLGSWYSSSISGLSVDNLAPPAPTPFTVAPVNGTNLLGWSPVAVSDFARFELHRGTTPGFVPSVSSRIASTSDTSYADPSPSCGTTCIYKLVAVDTHGNPSAASTATPISPIGVEPGIAAHSFQLSAPRPSPMRETATIEFSLPTQGDCRLAVHDVAGRLRWVRELTGVAGSQRIVWDGRDRDGRVVASGMYFLRLDAAGRSISRPLVVLR